MGEEIIVKEDNADTNAPVLTCELTTTDLIKRKQTVIDNLKRQLLEKKELVNGYAFKFTGNNKMVDELVEFIKTERACCSFFTFSLIIKGDKSEAWLELTGPEGAKAFITDEMGM